MPDELEEVMSPPRELMYLWEWLRDHMYPLSFTELVAWQGLTGRHLSRWEVSALVLLDKVRSHGQ